MCYVDYHIVFRGSKVPVSNDLEKSGASIYMHIEVIKIFIPIFIINDKTEQNRV
jgi:hypothetical protein